MTTEEITNRLHDADVKATPQRIAVYRYLWENRTHPDADEVYRGVVADNPSFSKTTVYNSLQALADSGLIIRIDIDDDRKRFDANTAPHGHFRCEKCGGIYDFDILDVRYAGLDNFRVTGKQFYFSGICSRCQKKSN